MEQEQEPLNSVPWGWYLGIVAVIAGTCVLLVTGWSSIPDPFPWHWNASGQPETFREKQVVDVLFVVLTIPVIFLVAGVLAALMDHSRQTVHGTEGESDRARMLSNLVQPALPKFCFAGAAVATISNLGSVFGLTQGPWWFWGTLGVIVALILGFFRKSVTITRQVEEKYPSEESGRKFKWGLFYFDPDDDEMIIHSGGLNLPNLGNKYFWVLLGVLGGTTGLIAFLAFLAEQ